MTIVIYKIRHPGTMEYLYFKTKEEAKKYYEGFNQITMMVCDVRYEEVQK